MAQRFHHFLRSVLFFLLKTWHLTHVYNHLGALWYCNYIRIYKKSVLLRWGSTNVCWTPLKRLRFLDGYAFRQCASTSFLFRPTCREKTCPT
jgi:hypothetical protein